MPDHGDLRHQAFLLAHTAGHEGTQKTLHRLRADFYIPGDRTLVQDWVRSCVTCQQNKTLTQRPASLLQPLEVPSQVWADISMDFIEGHFPDFQLEDELFAQAGRDVMSVVGLRGLWRKKERLLPRYRTRGATVPAGIVHEMAAARARERRLGLGALGTPATGLCPRPAREKGFPSNLLLH